MIAGLDHLVSEGRATWVGQYRVSTVPIIEPRGAYLWETLVFHAGEDVAGERYRTEAEAQDGHARWVTTAGAMADRDAGVA